MVELDFDDPKVKILIRNLHSFARGLYHQLFNTDPNQAGMSPEDYVSDALVDFICGEGNFDETKSPLNYHLKFHVIKPNMIKDLPENVRKKFRAEQKRVKSDHAEMGHIIAETEPLIEPDDVAEIIEDLQNILKESILKEIEAAIGNDSVVEQIYVAIVLDEYKISERSRICSDWDIPLAEFDLGKKRFFTIVNRVLKNHNITKP